MPRRRSMTVCWRGSIFAEAIFGRERVERDFTALGSLRDHIRRTGLQGRRMVDGGYRKLLE